MNILSIGLNTSIILFSHQCSVGYTLSILDLEWRSAEHSVAKQFATSWSNNVSHVERKCTKTRFSPAWTKWTQVLDWGTFLTPRHFNGWLSTKIKINDYSVYIPYIRPNISVAQLSRPDYILNYVHLPGQTWKRLRKPVANFINSKPVILTLSICFHFFFKWRATPSVSLNPPISAIIQILYNVLIWQIRQWPISQDLAWTRDS